MDSSMEVGLMFNALANTNFDVNEIKSLLEGHLRFLDVNTGTTYDGEVQHYVFNEEGLQSNNRHYIAKTMMEYQPNGDSVTEGQAIQILGELYSYMGTHEKRYLDLAEEHFEAYVKYYYAGDPVPDEPRRWIANWIANGKEPILASFPINPRLPTQGGYKNVPVRFVNGKATIPHGSPFWGEYLDVCIVAHRGHMAWPAINGGIRQIDENLDWDDIYDNHRVMTMPDEPWSQTAWIDWQGYLGKPEYVVDWNKTEEQHLIEYIVAWTNNKIGVRPGNNDELWGGDILETGLPDSRKGEIQLRDHTINGVYTINYAAKLPVEHGGYMFERNEVWHNRPVNVPLRGELQRGNAADAELWFCDCCYVLWILTGKIRYYNAWRAVVFTLEEYVDVDAKGQFFRRDAQAISPFTDGISYDWNVPIDAKAIYSRDSAGYVILEQPVVAQSSLEQQAIWYKVNPNSKIVTEVGGLNTNGVPVSSKVEMYMNVDKTDNGVGEVRYTAQLPPISPSPTEYEIPMKDFVAYNKPDGSEYMLADWRSVTEYGTATVVPEYRYDILDNRPGNTMAFNIPDRFSGGIVGFWLLDTQRSRLESVTYTSDKALRLQIEDAEGWQWERPLAHSPTWTTETIRGSDFELVEYQENEGTPSYQYPDISNLIQFTFMTEVGDNKEVNVSYYCVNDIPPRYNLPSAYTIKYRLTFSSDAPYTVLLGDCIARDYDPDSLAYVPGVIPFSNIYNVGSQEFDGWHGMPYPGYQHPFVYIQDETPRGVLRMNNMIDFLYDSQQWFYKEYGILGPGASAYVWNRWDNFKYGPPDTFLNTHWGGGHAWTGYQARAYFSAARCWYELVIQGKPVPPRLIEYVDNWSNYLNESMLENNGVSLTDITTEGELIYDPNDFTGHMVGLWLAGACIAHLAGSTFRNTDSLVEMLVSELARAYVTTGVPNHVMDGSWSPAVRLSTGSGVESNGMFFSFWSGEILRGLGLYLLYKNLKPGENMYRSVV